MDDPDAELMLAARDGDDGAFSKLVERHRQPVMNFFFRMGVNMTDAEDMAQQTFIRLYRHRGIYRQSAKFTTWLYLIARQVRVDEIRASVRRERLRKALKREVEAQAAMPHAPSQPGLRDDLQAALGSLDEKHRAAVVLGLVQELPYTEVAEILDIPVGTVKSRIFHALKKLKAYLEK